ncbi:hypothetical protein EMIT0P74_160132 [Pseudomonas sp. IT-P74]
MRTELHRHVRGCLLGSQGQLKQRVGTQANTAFRVKTYPLVQKLVQVFTSPKRTLCSSNRPK